MLRAALGILVVVCLTATAHAQPGNTPPAGPPPPATYVPPAAPYGAPVQTRTDSYPLSIVGVDALAGALVMIGAIALVSGAIDGDEDSAGVGVALMIGGGGVYAFGPAYVHVKHKNNSSAWKSVALRLGLPMLGGMLGNALDEQTCDEYGCYDSGGEKASSLASVGMLSAMVIDWAILAKHQVPVQPAYYPYAAPTYGGGGTIGLGGAF